MILPSQSLKIEPLSSRGRLLSLVLPTYNERHSIAPLVAHLTQLLDGLIPGRYELIVVDDNSPDGTWQVAQNLMSQYAQLRVVQRQQQRGLASAVVCGWQQATGEILGVMDADQQHPPKTLVYLLAQIQSGADLAVASRHVAEGGVSDWCLTRRLLSRGAQVLGLAILPSVVGRVSDPMSGYFLVRRSAIAGPELDPLGYKILLEVIGRGKINQIAEVGYVFQERESGSSKVTWRQYVDYLRHLARLRCYCQSQNRALGRADRQQRVQRSTPPSQGSLQGVFVDVDLPTDAAARKKR